MGLNDIKLQEFIVTEWYSDNLLPSPKPANSNYGEFATVSSISPNTIPAPSAAPPLSPKTTPPTPNTTPHPNPTTLVPSPAKTPTPTVTPQTPTAQAPIKYLGNNRRHITLLVHSPGSPFLPDNQLAFLTKILEACRLTLADIAIVNNAAAETNIAATPITISDIRRQLTPRTILLFGLEPSTLRLPINFPPFKTLDYDGCTYLSAPGLEQLVSNTEESKLLKSKLWVCLKTIFDV
jgi:hypothetical protein